MSPLHAHRTPSSDPVKVVLASSMGTVFEWYDFYLYGALATVIGQQFFGGLDSSRGFVLALLAFAAGFIVRPFGAIFFGRLGDLIGRKYTFLITLILMGGSTAIVGMLPTMDAIGVAAPVFLVCLRMIQGFALGGEYGGAATYVAEHAPADKRGRYTAWIQTTATIGLLLSLLVITGTRALLGEEAFAAWGWRIPFLLSLILLSISVWIRVTLPESPVFQQLKATGMRSRAPVTESFGNWANLKLVLVALFGLTAGQAVIWYAGHFHALFFLSETLKVETSTANLLVATALVLGAPLFIVFGHLSDKVGRRPVILSGCLLAAATYFPTFQALMQAANPALVQAHESVKVTLRADPAACHFMFNPVSLAVTLSPCNLAKQALTEAGVNHHTTPAAAGTVGALIQVGTAHIAVPQLDALPPKKRLDAKRAFEAELATTLTQAGYPFKADPEHVDIVRVVILLTYLIGLVAMVYGPVAAALVEMFPARIRYTSVSLPYHIGNGWFGGLLPAIAFAVSAQTGHIMNGLWYPVIVSGLTFVVGIAMLKETRSIDVSQ